MIDWAEAYEAIHRERQSYGTDPARFPILLGVEDVEAMAAFITEDALDTTSNHLPALAGAGVDQGLSPGDALRAACATMLATHSQMYLELGLWLAQTGRVKP